MSLENSGGRGVRVSYGNRQTKSIVLDESLTLDTNQLYAIGPVKIQKATLSTLSSANPAPIDIINNVLYGYFSNTLYKSSDEGDTWQHVYTFNGTGGELKRLMLCSDGQIIALFASKILKSISWPNPISWEDKIVLTEGQFIEWGIDGDGTKFIIADYGVPHTGSNYLWISLDSAETFSRYEKNVLHPGDDTATHFHGVAYDYIDDRFWHCMGDNTYKGHFYSDNDGTTWTEVTLGATTLGNAAQATTISTSPFGMILGSDSGYNNGIYHILRKENPSDMQLDVIWRWHHPEISVRGFPFKNVYDPVSGLTFTCWRTDVSTSPPMITWSNGFTGGILYEYEDTWTADDGIRNIVVFPNGKIKAWVSLAGVDDRVITLDKFHLSTKDVTTQDTGFVLGGTVTGSPIGVAVGAGSTAISQSVAVGAGSEAIAASSVAVGWSASAGINSTAVGTNADALGDNNVVLGNQAQTTVNANECVIIGSASTSNFEDSILIGRNLTNSGIQNVILAGKAVLTNNGTRQVVIGWLAESAGTQNVVIGRISKGLSTNGTAVGYSAIAGLDGTSLGSGADARLGNDVALGKNTVTTLIDSVAIGTRDLHVQGSTKGVILTSPDGTKYRITVDNAGVLSTAVVS